MVQDTEFVARRFSRHRRLSTGPRVDQVPVHYEVYGHEKSGLVPQIFRTKVSLHFPILARRLYYVVAHIAIKPEKN